MKVCRRFESYHHDVPLCCYYPVLCFILMFASNSVNLIIHPFGV
jgi:hypothetical protein